MRHALLLLGFAVALAGCGFFRATPPAAPDDALLVLINRTEEPVHYVYLSPCDGTAWGADRMDPDEVVMPGRTRTFVLEPGCWDLRAVLTDERVIDERGIDMTRNGRRTWTLFPDGG